MKGALVAVLLVVSILASYVLSYTSMGRFDRDGGLFPHRHFPTKSCWTFYWPLGWIESRVRGHEIWFTSDEDEALDEDVGPIFTPEGVTPYRVHGGVI